MPAPVVQDIEFLALSALNFDRKAGNIRVAYWAGLVCGFEIAKVFTTGKVVDVEPEFWTTLAGNSFPVDSTAAFVNRLRTATVPNLKFEVRQVPESGLRLGRPGQYYAQGIWDAARVGIRQVPIFFKYIEGDDWPQPTLKWVDQKLAWAKDGLAIEKSKAQDFIF